MAACRSATRNHRGMVSLPIIVLLPISSAPSLAVHFDMKVHASDRPLHVKSSPSGLGGSLPAFPDVGCSWQESIQAIFYPFTVHLSTKRILPAASAVAPLRLKTRSMDSCTTVPNGMPLCWRAPASTAWCWPKPWRGVRAEPFFA